MIICTHLNIEKCDSFLLQVQSELGSVILLSFCQAQLHNGRKQLLFLIIALFCLVNWYHWLTLISFACYRNRHQFSLILSLGSSQAQREDQISTLAWREMPTGSWSPRLMLGLFLSLQTPLRWLIGKNGMHPGPPMDQRSKHSFVCTIWLVCPKSSRIKGKSDLLVNEIRPPGPLAYH